MAFLAKDAASLGSEAARRPREPARRRLPLRRPRDVLCARCRRELVPCHRTRASHGGNGQRHRRCVPRAEAVPSDVLRRHRRASARRSQARRGRRSPAARRGPGRCLPCLPAESGRAGALCAAPSPDAWSARPAPPAAEAAPPRASPRAHLLGLHVSPGRRHFSVSGLSFGSPWKYMFARLFARTFPQMLTCCLCAPSPAG